MLSNFNQKIHLIVVDDMGPLECSLEDMIEEIVGKISDEFDDDDLMYSKIDDNTFVMDGKTYLEFYRILSIKDPKPFEDNKESRNIGRICFGVFRLFPKAQLPSPLEDAIYS